ncbi:monocarboxylate transporter 12-like isoform X2 [Gigantopelta aegis]|uniref:monocarboxylate transporter 12-like isoform X2 n=1 Tax=Gigantopelta aegis TaxID=1735272 RepID=UPI001B88AF1F|nr:monocarboxylate transporter 12-like isoform X2 [Gigantopelta aegis]
MSGSATDKYGWVVVAASFCCMFLNTGINYAVGVLHLGLVETYPEDEHLVVWLSSLFGAMFALSGLGHGLSYSASTVILGYYFSKDTALAVGIVMTGVGLAMFVHPPLTSLLMTSYGLRRTFLILGGITFQSCVFGMLMRPSKYERGRHLVLLSGRDRRQTVLQIICGGDVTQFGAITRNIPFVFLLVSVLTFSIALTSLYLFLPDYFVQSGASHQVASFTVSMSGIGSVISRIVTGFAANDPQIGCVLLLAGLVGVSGVVTACISLFSTTVPGQLTFGFLLGLYTGGVWVVLVPVVIRIIGVELLSSGYGLVMLVVGIGCLVGPSLSGLVLKVSDQYVSVFLFCAVLCFTSSIVCFLTSLPNSTRHTESDVHGVETSHHDLHLDKTYLSDNHVCNSDPEQEHLMLQRRSNIVTVDDQDSDCR